PKVQGDATGIHPITIMFALLACNVLWGPFGMLISTPIAIIVKAILSEVHSYLVSDDDAPAGKSGPGTNTPQTV
ncbi:MAG: AI-2E family transporter, partial [Clostridia bacterium]|nr:AI-2E family transporter [Clostridia bacterium]